MKLIFSLVFLSISYSSFSQLIMGSWSWYEWWSDYSDQVDGFRPEPELFIIYPDTFLVNLTADSLGNVIEEPPKYCSIGQNFDPYTKVWARRSNHTLFEANWIDSVAIDYGYFRENPNKSIVDTLILQYFRFIDNSLFVGAYRDSMGEFAVPSFDTISGLGLKPFYELKVPLTDQHETPILTNGDFNFKKLMVNFNHYDEFFRGDYIHVALHFKPGQSYSRGDTLYFDTALIAKGHTPPKNKLNRFGVMVSIQDNPLKFDDTTYNNGSFLLRKDRYGSPKSTPDILKEKYYPHIFEDKTTFASYFPHIAFRNFNFETSIDGMPSFKWSLYPNPVNDFLILDLELQNSTSIKTSVLSVTGQTLLEENNHDLSAGASQINIDVSSLQPGIYFLKTQADKGTQMLRFVVE